LKDSIYIFFAVWIFFIAGCATTQDLRALRSELNQKMDEKMDAKMAVVDSELTALKKNVKSLEAIRSGQASAVADITDLRENLQQLRGQVETLKKDFTSNTKKEDQRFDNYSVENYSLKEQVENLSKELERYKNLEKTLQETLTSATKSSSELRANALKRQKSSKRNAQLEAKRTLRVQGLNSTILKMR